ncbi:MAG: FAD binding domain-containing protein [Spirochaetales bacterium]|nr:FAD binding domain-containing protein [Spirochaetales bacterium]
MLCEFTYLAPKKEKELLDILTEKGPELKLLAGGTDLLANIRLGVITPTIVVDLKKIPGYNVLRFDKKAGLEVGPAVTINQLKDHPDVKKNYHILTIAAEHLASHQLRNRATVIGNIVNASPSADMVPALLCLEASVVIVSKEGERTVPLKEFFTGVKKTVLRPEEILSQLLVPEKHTRAKGGFFKLKRIQGHDLGVVGVALLKTKDEYKCGISSAAPTPVLVEGIPLNTPAKKIIDKVLGAITPIDDIRGSKDYRNFMVGVYIKRLLEELR